MAHCRFEALDLRRQLAEEEFSFEVELNERADKVLGYFAADFPQ